MARHKRILRDGQVSRGPARWARAAANALAKPNSKAGRLYLKRTSLAFQVAEEARNSALFRDATAFQHNTLEWRSIGVFAMKREMVSCSVFCAVMTAQLQNNADTLEKIKNAFADNIMTWKNGAWEDSYVPKIMPLNYATLTRSVRCFYCGSTVSPKK